MSQALKEDKLDSPDETFAQKFDALQGFLEKLNKRMAEKSMSLAAYKNLYKRFSDCVPEAWLYSLYNVDIKKFWNDDGNFDKEEFLKEEKCKGVSELQSCCNSSSDCDESIDESDEADKGKEQKRESRKNLCKKCFWFNVLLKILDKESSGKIDSKHALRGIVSALPDEMELFKKEADAIIDAWLCDVPPEDIVFDDDFEI